MDFIFDPSLVLYLPLGRLDGRPEVLLRYVADTVRKVAVFHILLRSRRTLWWAPIVAPPEAIDGEG